MVNGMDSRILSIPLSAAPLLIHALGTYVRIDLGIVQVGNEIDFHDVRATVMADDEAVLVKIQLDQTHDIWNMDNAIDATRAELMELGVELGEQLDDNGAPAGAVDFDLVHRP